MLDVACKGYAYISESQRAILTSRTLVASNSYTLRALYVLLNKAVTVRGNGEIVLLGRISNIYESSEASGCLIGPCAVLEA